MKFDWEDTLSKVWLVLLIVFLCHNARAAYVPQDYQPVPATKEAIVAAYKLAREVNGQLAAVAATGSMEPAITAKDIVIYQAVDFANIRKGDVIIFRETLPGCHCPPSVYAHRVVDVIAYTVTIGRKLQQNDRHQWVMTAGHQESSMYLVTKGDHNEAPDQFQVTADKVIGRIVYVVNGQTQEVRKL